jgi:hypothetical protein
MRVIFSLRACRLGCLSKFELLIQPSMLSAVDYPKLELMFSKDATLNLFLHAASRSTTLHFHRKSALDLLFSRNLISLSPPPKIGRTSFDDSDQKDKITSRN